MVFRIHACFFTYSYETKRFLVKYPNTYVYYFCVSEHKIFYIYNENTINVIILPVKNIWLDICNYCFRRILQIYCKIIVRYHINGNKLSVYRNRPLHIDRNTVIYFDFFPRFYYFVLVKIHFTVNKIKYLVES